MLGQTDTRAVFRRLQGLVARIVLLLCSIPMSHTFLTQQRSIRRLSMLL